MWLAFVFFTKLRIVLWVDSFFTAPYQVFVWAVVAVGISVLAKRFLTITVLPFCDTLTVGTSPLIWGTRWKASFVWRVAWEPLLPRFWFFTLLRLVKKIYIVYDTGLVGFFLEEKEALLLIFLTILLRNWVLLGSHKKLVQIHGWNEPLYVLWQYARINLWLFVPESFGY